MFNTIRKRRAFENYHLNMYYLYNKEINYFREGKISKYENVLALKD